MKKEILLRHMDRLLPIIFYVMLVILFLRPSWLKFSTPFGHISLTSAKNIALVFSALWLIAMFSSPRRYFTPCKLGFPLLLLLAVSIISALLSPFGKPGERLEALQELLFYSVFLYACLYLVRTSVDARGVVRLLLPMAVTVSIVDIIYHYNRGLWLVLDQGYPCWDGKNALGLFMAMSLSLCTSLIVSAHRRPGTDAANGMRPLSKWRRSPLFAGLFVVFLGLIYSYSRGAWLAMIGATLAFGLMRSWKLVALAAIALLVLVILPHRKASHRFRSIWQMRDGNVAKRVIVWKDAVTMIRTRPLLGVGPGAFRTACHQLVQRSPGSGVQEDSKERMRFCEHAHNLYLHIGAETGLSGFIIFLWLLLVIGRASIHRLKKASDPKEVQLVKATIASLVAFLVFSLVDSSWSGRFSGSSFMHINLMVLLLTAILLTPQSREIGYHEKNNSPAEDKNRLHAARTG
jgi:O-antigen ligase